MVGIYKITSPTGKVYIGQSFDIDRRFRWYRVSAKIKCPLIQRSIKKYGYDAHTFEVLCELPSDVDKKTLSIYEMVYMDQYRECGFRMLNLSAAGDSPYGVKRSDKNKRAHSERMKGRPSPMEGKKHTEEAKAKIRYRRSLQIIKKGVPKTEEQRRNMSIANKGKPRTTPMPPMSEETKQKLRLANLGKKLSPETIAKRTATFKNSGKKRRWNEESKRKRSEALKGYKMSEGTKLKIKEALLKFHRA